MQFECHLGDKLEGMAEPNKPHYYNSKTPMDGFIQTFQSFLSSRDIIRLLVKRDLTSRYRRSFFGIIWTLLNPIFFGLVLWVVFVSIFKSSLSNGTQFGPYVLAGVLTITFFNQGVLQAAESISNGRGLFLKVRIDPVLVVIANTISNLVNFFLGIFALGIVTFVSKADFSIAIPGVFILGIFLALFISGIGMMLGNLFVKFDDLKNIITVTLQILTYLTPIFYPKEILDEKIRLIVNLNPLTSFLDGFRFLFNGTEIVSFNDWIYIFVSSLMAFSLGLYFFRKTWAKTVVMM